MEQRYNPFILDCIDLGSDPSIQVKSRHQILDPRPYIVLLTTNIEMVVGHIRTSRNVVAEVAEAEVYWHLGLVHLILMSVYLAHTSKLI